MNDDDLICHCFHVKKRKILNFIRVRRPRRASQVSECGGAGTGCGWCIPFLERYYSQWAQQQAASVPSVEPAAGEGEELNASEYARQRAEYVRSGKGTPPPGAMPLPPADGK